jgi:hypothetical protein
MAVSVDRVAEVEALKTLKARYFYYLDNKHWEQWRSLFADDATLKINKGKAVGTDVEVHRFDGADAIVNHTSKALADPISVHQGHTPIFEFDSDTEARGIWAMMDIIDLREKGGLEGYDAVKTGARGVLTGYGHYHETYRKIDGEWKFASIHLTKLLVMMSPS